LIIHLLSPLGGRISTGYLKSMLTFQNYCQKERIQLRFFTGSGADIYVARTECLMPQPDGELIKGPYPVKLKEKKPFNGELEYDFIVWIDSDMVFTPEQIIRLIGHNVDIVSGMCLRGPNNFAMGYYGKNDDGYFFSSLKLFSMETGQPVLERWMEEYQQENGLCSLDYCGMAFVVIKKGIYESIDNPWYRTTIVNDGVSDTFASEDVGFCCRAREAGFKIWADPYVHIGHEKVIELRGQ
jgi:hypothetical protein